MLIYLFKYEIIFVWGGLINPCRLPAGSTLFNLGEKLWEAFMPKKSKYENVKCSVQDCNEQAKCKGLCLRHYKRFNYCGSTKVSRPCYHEPIDKKFWRYVDKKSIDECWIWTGRKDKDGYGSIRDGKLNRRAHRVSYELNIASIPNGKMIRHSCNNPSCVNPNHLLPGTQVENMQDRKDAGNEPIGEHHQNHKFSDNIIRQIKAFRGTYKEISNIFNISESQVGNIKRGDQRKLTTQGELF